MIQASDTPTSQSTAARWTFYRRLGLLLRTRLTDEGTTLSLHDVAARTNGRVSAEQLAALLAHGSQADADPVTCVLLAQAFDVDPDFFITDEALNDYIRSMREEAQALGFETASSLQQLAYSVTTQRAPVLAR